jgi:ubiquinone/menaquinone biosynthesis C-methylase UbiE
VRLARRESTGRLRADAGRRAARARRRSIRVVSDEHAAQRARSFGAAADEYERARPTYPDAAVDWLLPAGVETVLDLGAGTGKLTRALVSRGLDVIAVEPLEDMRAILERELPDVRALAGTAESIPVPDASVDAVTAAQAWHWVDESRALPEVARVLRPGGALCLIWNRRDERVEWVRALSDVMGASDADLLRMEDVAIGAPFGTTETFDVSWQRSMDLELLLDMVRSRSYFITATSARREQVLAGVRALAESNPALRGDTFQMPYRTYCFRARVGDAR